VVGDDVTSELVVIVVVEVMLVVGLEVLEVVLVAEENVLTVVVEVADVDVDVAEEAQENVVILKMTGP